MKTPRTQTVTFFDVDNDCGVRVTFFRLVPPSSNSSTYRRLNEPNQMMLEDFSAVHAAKVEVVEGPAPYQCRDAAEAFPHRIVGYMNTAVLVWLFDTVDRLPEPGYRIAIEREDED